MSNSENQENPNVACNQDKNSIFCSESTHKKMHEILGKFNIPDWILLEKNQKPRKCSYCEADLDIESVRGIGVCLNAQHFGDIQVEILCQACSSSYHLQFRKMCVDIVDFCMWLDGKLFDLNLKPVLLTSIKPSENNLSDLLILDDQNRIAKESN
jgi:hypothetical protein